MARTRRLAAAVALAAASLAAASGADAAERRADARANLVSNGSFERSLHGWAGYRARLLRARGVHGGRAVRVSLRGASDDGFSIYPVRRPVAATRRGVVYQASAWVRSGGRPRRVCLRVREWAGNDVAGANDRCVRSSRRWRPIPPVRYTARASGRPLDAYVYAWDARRGDSFEVDAIAVRRAAPLAAGRPLGRVRGAGSGRAAAGGERRTAAAGPVTAAAVDHAHVRLDWRAADGAVAYRVRRGAVVVGTTTATTFTDALLWPMSSYDYTVEALAAGGRVVRSEAVSAATRQLPAGGFPQLFPETSVWRRRVGGARVHPRNAALLEFFRANIPHPNMTLHEWGVAVDEVRPGDERHTIPCTVYDDCTVNAFGPVPMPLTAKPDPEGDGHLAVYDPAERRSWDLWQAARTAGGWRTGAGAAVSLAGDGIAPRGTAGATAANFPLLGGLIRPEEILQGHIDHALVFTMPNVSRLGHVCPATHNDGASTSPNALMEGQWLQLDPAVDVDALPVPAWQKTIARALQTYGMYLRDIGGSFAIYAENPISRGYDAWAAVGLPRLASISLRGIPWERMRVLNPPC